MDKFTLVSAAFRGWTSLGLRRFVQSSYLLLRSRPYLVSMRSRLSLTRPYVLSSRSKDGARGPCRRSTLSRPPTYCESVSSANVDCHRRRRRLVFTKFRTPVSLTAHLAIVLHKSTEKFNRPPLTFPCRPVKGNINY
jgi:hypothetical protein